MSKIDTHKHTYVRTWHIGKACTTHTPHVTEILSFLPIEVDVN